MKKKKKTKNGYLLSAFWKIMYEYGNTAFERTIDKPIERTNELLCIKRCDLVHVCMNVSNNKASFEMHENVEEEGKKLKKKNDTETKSYTARWIEEGRQHEEEEEMK